MSSEREFEGKNVKAAVKLASEALDISPDQIRYDIISYGATGIFGLVGSKKAKIRITNKVDAASTPEDRVADMIEAALPMDEATDEPDGSPGPNTARENAAETQVFENIEEKLDTGKSFLTTIIDAISDGAEIEGEIRRGAIHLDVHGGNTGAMIGKRGQTLEAIQYLVDKAVNRMNTKRIRVQVDVEGYFENRKQNLRKLAERMAEKAKKRGRPTTIGQMNAHDRRIIHLTLKSDQDVRTQSVGEGYLRKLVIFPKKLDPKKRRAR